MTTQTPQQVDAQLLAVGFSPDAAQIMTAIGQAESNLNDTALGDTALEDNTWGPSYGTYQVRTELAQTGTGGVRDINALAGSDLAQARAAYAISNGGTDFTPWTTFDNGAFRQYLPGGTTTGGGGGGRFLTSAPGIGGGGGGGGPISPTGSLSNIWVMEQTGGGGLVPSPNDVLTGVRSIALEALAALLGLALAGAGLYVLSSRTERAALAPVRRVVWGS